MLDDGIASYNMHVYLNKKQNISQLEGEHSVECKTSTANTAGSLK